MPDFAVSTLMVITALSVCDITYNKAKGGE